MAYRHAHALIALLFVSAFGYGQDFVINPYGSFGDSGAGSSFDKTAMVAWYDFDDATDSHGGSDLTVNAGTTYGSGYGIGDEDTNHGFLAEGIPSFGATDQDWSLVLRVRLRSGIDNFKNAFYGGAGWFVQKKTLVDVGFGGVSIGNTISPPIDTWLFVYLEWDSSAAQAKARFNDTSEWTATGVFAAANANKNLVNNVEADIDFAGFFGRVLTAEEQTQIYNAGTTTTYADL